MSAHDSGDPGDGSPPKPPTGGSGGASGESGDSAGLLDSLLKAFDERERRAAERGAADSADRATPPKPGPRGSHAGSRPHEPAERGQTIFTRSSTAASDIEALIQVAIDAGEADSDEVEVEVDPDAFEADVSGDEVAAIAVDEDRLDESLFEELSEAAESGADDPAGSSLDDPVLAADAPAEPAELALLPVAADAERADSDDWLTDLKPEQSLASDSELLPPSDEPGAEFENDPEALTSPEMEDVLAAAPRSAPSTATTFDDLFNEEDPGTAEDLDPIAAIPVSSGQPAAAPEGKTLSETTVMEDIGSENVAAGAAGDSSPKPSAAPAPKPAAPKPEPAPAAAATAPQPPKRRSWLPPSPIELLGAQPRRAAAAIAAGLLVGGAEFAYLAANRFLDPATALRAGTPMPLDRAMRLSESMMEERDFAGALRVLDDALRFAPKTDAHYADAEFQRLEVLVARMPAELTPQEANALHVAIDSAVLDGRQHPRTAEALVWKAQVYERENNAAAARAEYRGILEDYGNAPNRDEVLLRLGQLELKLGRPYEAISIARQLTTDYPRSNHLNAARLLLGDASAAAGDPEGARVAYIRLAEEAMDSEVGAEAFERLGKIAIDSGEPDTAIRELQSRLQSATTVEGNERVYLVLARAYRASKQPGEARKILNELLEFFPESEITPLALIELSQVMLDLGLDAEAARFAERSAERYPDHPEVLVNAATLYARSGQHERAGRTMLDAFGAGAERPAVLLAAGRELELGGAPVDAKAAFERVVLEFPGTPEAIDAHIGWARSAIDLGEVNAAYLRLDQIAKTTEGRPRQLPALVALAGLYTDLGLQQDAIAMYSKVATVTDDPAALADAALHLIDAGAADEGLAIAQRVDVARLTPAQAYPFIEEWGRAMLRADSDTALELLQRAHDDYPEQRTSAGVGVLMKAVLALGRTAQARAILAEMQARTSDGRYAAERPLFVAAAADYGDYLYSRGDYAAAAEAYAMASAKSGGSAGEEQVTDTEYWNAYQRANALSALGRVDESLLLYDLVSASGASVARDAQVRGEATRIHQRREFGPANGEAGG